ncbi:hypothetical protein [Mycobacterium shimoidei]|uniref:Uncharacterized protein n=1 Tax=Mycobacterium shimoidei TaxID=29313 RepID=A0A1E3T2L7_MYCSH|nr:hypothetical protein [Mycobacterium shimoidei]MCV7261155.1 hypothetical protein [Mycobacterium shimoidei]ODR08641.1 hypothetical protein BHQ16_20335 [Mycobacterium shimoidei]ORW82943.1 hypothetical protein AWC26_03830 [Mycobacterium shimoidei]SRX94893.1 hypothetical protein [Saccharomonospora viridis DSM 43017] [Mycobacterium shimoidei]
MKVKRQAPQRRDSGRRRGHDNAPGKGKRRPVEPAAGRRAHAGKASAPAREPRVSRSSPQTTPISRPVERPARPKNTSQAKARAKARKAKAPKVIRPPLRERLLTRLASIDLRPRTLAAKVPFVVLIIGSLGTGLGITLWLSTDSAERSYELANAREKNRLLQQQKEALERDVLQAEAAPALAEAARNLGMIPTRDTAHLVQDPAGNWVVVGTPKPAEGVPPPPLNTKLPEEKPPSPPPAMNSVEVPVRVLPGGGAPVPPATTGPEVLLRDPTGATTLGAQPLPDQTVPVLPGLPQAPALGPATVAPVAPLPAPAAPLPPAVGEQFGPLSAMTPGAAR